MLSGSAILRVSLLLAAAGLLTAMVQYLLPPSAPAPSEPVQAPAPAAPAPRKIETLPAPRPDPAPVPAANPAPPPQARPAPPPAASPEFPAPRTPPEPKPAPLDLAVPQLSPPTGQAAVDEAADNTGPRALTLIDINTASVAQLNGLRGGGSIGRAIVAKRPYTAIDQLLSKRVLSRATYDKIKDQITVR